MSLGKQFRDFIITFDEEMEGYKKTTESLL